MGRPRKEKVLGDEIPSEIPVEQVNPVIEPEDTSEVDKKTIEEKDAKIAELQALLNSRPAQTVPNSPTFTLERRGDEGAAQSYRLPRVIGGVCEFCGIIDPRKPSIEQYKLCRHYKEIGAIRCTYCDKTRDPNHVVGHSLLQVATHPDNINKLVVWCDSLACSDAHIKRFDPSRK